jgi:hypothetical protein
LPPIGVIYSWTNFFFADGAVGTLVLVRFADGTQSFGNLLHTEREPDIGAQVELVGELATTNGTRRLFQLPTTTV